MNKLELLNYDDLIETCFQYYMSMYGISKFETIKNKVLNEKRTLQFLSYLNKVGGLPEPSSFLLIVNKIPYFLFSKQITTVIASIVVFQKWVEDNRYQLPFSDNIFKDMVLDILEKSKMINYIC